MGSPGTDSEIEFRMQGVTKEHPGDQPLGKTGETKQERQREVKVRCRSETTLHHPRGALDLEWLFRVTPSWVSESWALNLPHGSLFEYTSHSSQENAWWTWPLKTVRWAHSQDVGQQVLYWRSCWAVCHNVHLRPELKLSTSFVLQIWITSSKMPSALLLYLRTQAHIMTELTSTRSSKFTLDFRSHNLTLY